MGPRAPLRLLALGCLAATGCLDFDQFGRSLTDAATTSGDDLPNGGGDGASRDLTVPTPGDLAEHPKDQDAQSCPPNSFVKCDGNDAIYCDKLGSNTYKFDCGGLCVGPNDCGQCTPGISKCEMSQLSMCTPQGSWLSHVDCPVPVGAMVQGPGPCYDMQSCTACLAGNNKTVCGDLNSNTAKDTEYGCVAGVLGKARRCYYGCDTALGMCREVVPANAAQMNLAIGDVWTCDPRAQNAMLPSLGTGTPATVYIDTSAMKPSIVVNNKLLLGVPWGAPYVPQGQHTAVRVAHVRAIDLAAGSTFLVGGTYGLILLVDGDVTFGQANNVTATHVSVAANLANPGPGAPANAGVGQPGGTSSGIAGGGGGAGHGTVGGNGGTVPNGVAPAQGGTAYSSGSGVFLEAGASGGGGVHGLQYVPGGGGGGALQVTACGAITLYSGVTWNASGGGGAGGEPGGLINREGGGGGGGGSAGTLVLEGALVDVQGTLVGNGGGGGAGGISANLPMPGMAGFEWTWGLPIAKPALGGQGPGARGGSGGCVGNSPTAGGNGEVNTSSGSGGGGGAAGMIYVNVSPLGPKAVVPASSPAAIASFVCVTAGGVAPNPCVYP